MDMRVVGLLADLHQAQLRDEAARERASRGAPRPSGRQATARVVLAALFGAALAAAPLVVWAAWLRGR